MNNRLSIVKKGLLLIATPLTIQAIFIGMLIQAQVEGANAQEWAVHTKEVIARVEEIYRLLLEGYAGIRILAVSDNPSIGQPFRAALQRIPERIEELRVRTSDNEDQKPRIDKIARQSLTFRDWLANEERLLESGERGKALDGLDLGARLLGTVRATTDEVLDHEQRLDSDRMGRWRRSTVRQLWTVIGGGIVFLCTTLVLSLLFLNGVIRRLAVLRDNARRFAEGKATRAAVSRRRRDRRSGPGLSRYGDQSRPAEAGERDVRLQRLARPALAADQPAGLQRGAQPIVSRPASPFAARGRTAGGAGRRPQAHDARTSRIRSATFKRPWAGWRGSSMHFCGCRAPAGSSISGRRSISRRSSGRSSMPCTTPSPPRRPRSSWASCRRHGATRPPWSRSSPT